MPDETPRESWDEQRARADSELTELRAIVASMKARRGLAPDEQSWEGFLAAHPELADLEDD